MCIYAEIFRNIDFGIVVLDTRSESVIFQNNSVKTLFRRSDKPDDYKFLCSLLLPKLKEGGYSGEKIGPLTIRHYDRILGYTAYTICEDYVWIFLMDITEKTRLESIAESVNTMQNIGYVFSGIRHEIGNPINSIKMTLSVLKNNIDKYSKENVLEYIDRSLAEILRVEYLLKSLKSFSLFEKAELQNVHIGRFMEKLISLVEEDFAKKNIKIVPDFHGDSKWAYADPRMLQQVMLNLLTNAADALEGRRNPMIGISVIDSPGFIWIRVEDNGCGIKRERLKELFKPFYTSKPHGTGLGLVICRKMLVNMNCTIEVNSAENLGTAVTISVPEGKADE